MKLPKYYLPLRRSHLDNKPVQWTTLEKMAGRHVDYSRSVHSGKVLAVSGCGNFALVQDATANDTVHDLEVAELTVL